ncbi:hypothetical protein T492DRAFT_1076145 [Pavlovales sp. CCMP2436]|nr:hypothetical protein T492DRAFT_1076145 [Pavlovales sp. CCMP2436]
MSTSSTPVADALGAPAAEDWTPVETSASGAEVVESDEAKAAPPRTPDPGAVSVVGFEKDADVAYFKVRVQLCSLTYELRRRYSQFEALARCMRVAAGRLPTRFLIRHTDENLAARGAALENWLRALLAADSGCASDVELERFLELEAARAVLLAVERAQHCSPSPSASKLIEELETRRARSAVRNCIVNQLESEKASLLRELSGQASQVKRLEFGMTTAKNLVATLRQQLIETERSRAEPKPETAAAPEPEPVVEEAPPAPAPLAPIPPTPIPDPRPPLVLKQSVAESASPARKGGKAGKRKGGKAHTATPTSLTSLPISAH